MYKDGVENETIRRERNKEGGRDGASDMVNLKSGCESHVTCSD